MKPNTHTSLSELRIGDRFCYERRADVWQVMEKDATHTLVNQVTAWGQCVHLHHHLKKNSTFVVFKRHTIPLPGETWQVQHLRNRDVFYLPGDELKHEYLITENEYPNKVVVCITYLGDEEKPVEFFEGHEVIFLRTEKHEQAKS